MARRAISSKNKKRELVKDFKIAQSFMKISHYLKENTKQNKGKILKFYMFLVAFFKDFYRNSK